MKNHMKVLLVLMLSLSLVFSLVACKSKSNATKKPQKPVSEVEQNATSDSSSSQENIQDDNSQNNSAQDNSSSDESSQENNFQENNSFEGNSQDNNSSNENSNENNNQNNNSSAQNSEENSSGDNRDKIMYIDRDVEGTYTMEEQPSDAFEYVADDAYKVLSGGADKEAEKLRNKILNAKDSYKPTGKIYYFSTDGKEDNNGLSTKTPIRNLDSINELDLKPGDAVLFKRGCIFRTTITLKLVSGVYYGAYGEGAKPEIWGSAQNYTGKNLWKPYGNKKNFWVMELLRDDAGVLVIDNGRIEGRKFSSVNALTYEGDFYHDAGNAIYLYSPENPNEYKSIEIGCSTTLMSAPAMSKDIKIENLSLKYTGALGINFSGKSNNIKISNCELSYIGGCYQFQVGGQRYGNAIQFWDGATNITVSNCWIHRIFDTGLTFQGSNDFCNIAFKNNLLEYCMMSIETWGRPASSRPTKEIKNINISDNIFRFSGYSYGLERDDNNRGAHITFAASSYNNDYDNIIKNYVVENNIFDCSKNNLIDHSWLEAFTKSVGKDYIYRGNTYYQKKRTESNRVANFGVKTNDNKQALRAENQKELEKAISIIDKSPKLVKWLK